MGEAKRKRKQEQRQVTAAGSVLTCTVDFLEFTLPADRFYDLVKLLGSDLTSLDRGWRGYTSSALVAGGFGRLGWNEDQERADAMGVHCSLGGQALGHLAAVDPRWADLAGILAMLRGWGGHVTRLDLAWDDKTEGETGALDLDAMREAVDRDNIVTRWRRWHDDRHGVRRKDRVDRSATLYLGSPASDAMLRVYNKRAERVANGHADQVEGVGHWVRVELQTRRERAQAAARAFEDVNRDPTRVFTYFAGVLKGYVTFVVPTADTNRRRWPVAPWWSAFLGAVKKARLAVFALQRTVEDVKRWVRDAVAPSLALVETALGEADGLAWLLGVTDQGRARWGPRHRAILKAAGVAC